MAVLYAILSLVFSALNDFIFKLFAGKKSSRGLLFFLIGLTACVLLPLIPQHWEHVQATILWGLAGGVLSVSANFILVWGMTMQSAGVASTIYRLNLVPTVLLAWLLLGEHISGMHWLGIAAALGATICFGNHGGEIAQQRASGIAQKGLLICIAASCLRAFMAIVYKKSFDYGADATGMAFMTNVCWIFGGLLYGLFLERHEMKFSKSLVKIGVISGALVGGICFCMAASLKCGNASQVMPIAQMSFPVTLFLSAVFLKEKITIWKAVGMILSVLAILLLIR